MASDTYNDLTRNNFLKINPAWFQYLGVDTTALLFDLLDKENYFIAITTIDKDGWFYYTDEKLQEIFPWSSNTIRNHLGRLSKLGLIYTENRGIPRKRYIKINRNFLYWFADLINTRNEDLKSECDKYLSDATITKVTEYKIEGKTYYV